MARKVSVAETRQHGIQEDVWIVVNGEVFDMTQFAPEHPGGQESKPTTASSLSEQAIIIELLTFRTQQSSINMLAKMPPRRTMRYTPRP
jgi:hypothetical protein